MPMEVQLSFRGAEALPKSEVNACLRRALEGMGWRWREQYLPKRFTKKGAREYGFRPRAGELNPRKRGTYTNRKLRLFGHTLPLRYTSEAYREALFTLKVVTATATSARATVRVRLPRKANFHIKDWTAISAAEIRDLEYFLAGRVSLELQKAGARHVSVRASIAGAPKAVAGAA
jgi:hypothetical protein